MDIVPNMDGQFRYKGPAVCFLSGDLNIDEQPRYILLSMNNQNWSSNCDGGRGRKGECGHFLANCSLRAGMEGWLENKLTSDAGPKGSPARKGEGI